MNQPESDIDRLIAQHPCWAISVIWASANTGPDARRLVATREGIRVQAWTAADLSALIAAEESAKGWPCTLGDPPVRQGVTAEPSVAHGRGGRPG